MIFIVLALGVFLAAAGAINYSLLRKREGVMFTIAGKKIPREWTAMGVFVFGVFLIIMFLVTEVEPKFYKSRNLQYPSNQIFHLIDKHDLDV